MPLPVLVLDELSLEEELSVLSAPSQESESSWVAGSAIGNVVSPSCTLRATAMVCATLLLMSAMDGQKGTKSSRLGLKRASPL